MIITINMKTTDCVENAVNDASSDPEERAEINELAEKWFEYGEAVTLELDTVRGTCRVVEL